MYYLIKKKTKTKYNIHPEAIIISCFFNPENSPYRLKAFKIFYESIKHLNHTIIECVIGNTQPQLKESENIRRLYTENLLWHKESLLNKIISELPLEFKYVFWIDADVLFTNENWLVDGVLQLQNNNIIQPFEYCVLLEKDEIKPSFSMDKIRNSYLPNAINNKVWRSFAANFISTELWKNEIYNKHGHVGFAWGAKRDILDEVPLFDKALIGGADHVIAHAAAGQIPHVCIKEAFKENIDQVKLWSNDFYKVTKGKIGFVEGDLYHMWHGDIDKRQYRERNEYNSKIKEIINRDENGLFITNKADDYYIKNYFKQKESQRDNKSYILNIFSKKK
jgi:hypothetical protein